MRVQRRYRCLDCGRKYVRTFEFGSPIDHACPQCGSLPNVPDPSVIAAPGIIGTKSRAIDETFRIAQEDYGFANMRGGAGADVQGMKEGDSAYIPPPQPKQTGPAKSGRFMWGGAQGAGATMQIGGPDGALGAARGAAALARMEGRSPMELLHRAKPKLTAIPLNK